MVSFWAYDMESTDQNNKKVLSKRELEILTLLAEGHTYSSISQELSISFHTVQAHVKNIYAKLNVNNKISAIRLALNYKLI
jgi:DNA-binding NarL/FixJ family response regulator